MTPKAPHERLAAAMDRRRQDLGSSWRGLAAEAGITQETLRAIRRGANMPSALTKRGIEQALRWAAGSIDAILAGGEPTLVDQVQPQVDAAVKTPSVQLTTEGRDRDLLKRESETEFEYLDRIYEIWKRTRDSADAQDRLRSRAILAVLARGE